MKPVSALTIAGSDSGGGAGIQADLKTFSAFEVHGLTAITSLTAQNSQGVEEIQHIPSEFVGQQIETTMKDFEVDWAKTGMIGKKDTIEIIIEKTEQYGLNLVVDPVMEAASGDPLLEMGAMGALKDLISKAKLVTPNLNEASELSEIKINSVEKMKDAAVDISRMGCENVLIKGGHLDEPEIHNVLLNKNDLIEYETEKIDIGDIHGTGCTFSAAITAELAKGADIKSAVKKLGDFMVDAVKKRLEIGKGNPTINPMAKIWKVGSKGKDIKEVESATKKLVDQQNFEKLIPQVGINIVKAPKNAQSTDEVIGLTGRIIVVNEKPYLSGVPKAGGSKHMANFVMSALKHDMSRRAAMNIKYSERILNKCKDLGFKVGEFDREKEPDGENTMRWGPDQVVEKLGKLPDIIYDEGAVGKEAMIRITGETAADVSEKALKILRELEK